MKTKLNQSYLAILLGFFILQLTGCITTPKNLTSKLQDMESIALCHTDEQALDVEKRIMAEYGFKRFAKNTYRPVVDATLFGHKIRVIELGKEQNKVYVAGNPKEFGHHFTWLLTDVSCDEKSCQAPINDGQTLHIYKFKLRKTKDTTIIECTKPMPLADDTDTDTSS